MVVRINSQSFDRKLPFWLRAFVRARETGLVLASVVVGIVAGLLVSAISLGSQFVHELLFNLPRGAPLSVSGGIAWYRLFGALAAGGIILAILTIWTADRVKGRLADAIEANALYGGRLSLTGSVYITLQTFISNAVGASVGLEAAYTQISSAFASLLGRSLAARRNDLRLLVGCGAGGAIAAAFGAPLAGAFYGFEVVLGAYTVGSLVPMVASAISATIVANAVHGHKLLVLPGALSPPHGATLGHLIVLGLIISAAAIVLMQGVAKTERLLSRSHIPAAWRPLLGAVLMGGLALWTPQVMASGHGALQLNLTSSTPLLILTGLIVAKGVASMISLGSGFRGGLFFASLLLGSMVGRLYAELVSAYTPFPIDPGTMSLAGLAAFGAGVIGSPVTMVVLALEMSGDFDVTVAALISSAIAALVVREAFGYSFATWRFHLRGETIRGPADIGWMRELTVARLMRKDPKAVPQDITIATARTMFPAGSERHIFLLDREGRYAGFVPTAELFATERPVEEPVSTLAAPLRGYLTAQMSVRPVLDAFEKAETDVLPVIDAPDSRKLIGYVTEAHVLRRYGEELERRNRAFTST
jgi:CIC family chloride channel protein